MSNIRRTILNLVNRIFYIKLLIAQSKTINKKLKYLLNIKKLRRFPLNQIKPYVSKYPRFTSSDKKWLDYFYSANGIADPGYIPLNYYYNFIEPCMNDITLLSGIKEKNFYELFFNDIDMPKTILRKMNGFYYNSSYEKLSLNEDIVSQLFDGHEIVILKPSVESGSGKSILRFERKNGGLFSNQDRLSVGFMNSYGKDFIIQEFVKQHEYFKRFNPTSNNTLRVFTYRSVKDDSINVLHKLLRIGKSGSYLDHDNLGGVGISVKDNYHFDKYAYDTNGERFESINNINFQYAGEVPFIEETCTIAVKIARKIYYARLLAMDFTVDSSGRVLLIEINCWKNGITQYQMNNGSLFKEFTEEILDYCYEYCGNEIAIHPMVSVKNYMRKN